VARSALGLTLAAATLAAAATAPGARAATIGSRSQAAAARAGLSQGRRTAGARRPQPRTRRRLTTQQLIAARDSQHAIATYQVMQRDYYLPGLNRYRGAFAWPYSQAMGATISVASLPGMHHQLHSDLIARLNGLATYADHVDPAPAGYFSLPHASSPNSARFNDDNEWIGIELLRLYHLDRSQTLLDAAGRLMTLVWSQWDSSASPCPGGVPWEKLTANGDRNTVSNATGAELGAQLYLYTGQQSYLDEAIQMYNWVRACLLDANGLYADHISADGTIDPTEWTYNQGEMIGAGVMLSKATGNSGYLDQAIATAQTSLATYGPPQLATEPTTFNAIYIRNLLLLGGVSGDPRYARFAQWYADDAWSNVRDPSSGLFRAGPGGTTVLLDQASMAQLYALLAEPPSLT
jgi:hypothetical protein